MTKTQWQTQAWLWRGLARLIPTCFLQWEMSKRPGVKSTRLAPNETGAINATGPAVLTVNRD